MNQFAVEKIDFPSRHNAPETMCPKFPLQVVSLLLLSARVSPRNKRACILLAGFYMCVSPCGMEISTSNHAPRIKYVLIVRLVAHDENVPRTSLYFDASGETGPDLTSFCSGLASYHPRPDFNFPHEYSVPAAHSHQLAASYLSSNWNHRLQLFSFFRAPRAGADYIAQYPALHKNNKKKNARHPRVIQRRIVALGVRLPHLP